jgi:hypothetical protein
MAPHVGNKQSQLGGFRPAAVDLGWIYVIGGAVHGSQLGAADHLAHALQLSLGTVFLLAAIPKARHPREFMRVVEEYRIAPQRVAGALAACTIVLESFLALAFLTGSMFEKSLALAAALLVTLTAGVAINLHRGRRISCGCFGDPAERISARSLARLMIMLLAVFALATIDASPLTFGTIAPAGQSALASLIVNCAMAAFLTAVAIWALSLPELAFTLRRLRRTETHLPVAMTKADGQR